MLENSTAHFNTPSDGRRGHPCSRMLRVTTATAPNGTWDVVIQPNMSGSVVLKADGNVDYYCRFHPNMIGQITIVK